ncbi:MAG: SRPBCC domain-containing protein [Bacteroidota bacterium]
MGETTPPLPKETLFVTRILDAPVEKIWKAWTDPKEVMKWWGPKYFASPSCVIDLREGGKYIFCMRAPKEMGGQDSYTSGIYTKIVPLARLEFTQGMSDKEGNRLDPSALGLPPDFPKELHTTIEFRRIRPDMTELIITESSWTPGQMYVYSIVGLHQCIDKLAESVK